MVRQGEEQDLVQVYKIAGTSDIPEYNLNVTVLHREISLYVYDPELFNFVPHSIREQ